MLERGPGSRWWNYIYQLSSRIPQGGDTSGIQGVGQDHGNKFYLIIKRFWHNENYLNFIQIKMYYIENYNF